MSRARSELCVDVQWLRVGVQTLPVRAGWTGAPGGEPGPVGAVCRCTVAPCRCTDSTCESGMDRSTRR